MRSFKKQTTALGFLILTALPLFYAAGIFIKQTILQQQRRMRFKTETLVTIQLPASEIVWVKQGKEILHNGQMFDVKSLKTSGSIVELTGFYDHKEDKLIKKIKGLAEQDKDGSLIHQLLVKFMFYPKNNDADIISIQSNWVTTTNRFAVYSELITHLVYTAPAPPPKTSLL